MKYLPMSTIANRLLITLLSLGVYSAELPDTGQTSCYDNSAANANFVEIDSGSHPRQDCRYGRDAAGVTGVLYKYGGGSRGFDYTKIANNGSELAASASLGSSSTDWACTRDNLTGLIWEVKVSDSTHLRHSGWAYTWYSSDSSTNGGNAGTADTGAGVGSDNCLNNARCDTEKFVADVNGAALCGYSDWRLATVRELHTLSHYGVSASPYVDSNYFPNTQPSNYWSASTYAPSTANAWEVYFLDGSVVQAGKVFPLFVRLVRGGQF